MILLSFFLSFFCSLQMYYSYFCPSLFSSLKKVYLLVLSLFLFHSLSIVYQLCQSFSICLSLVCLSFSLFCLLCLSIFIVYLLSVFLFHSFLSFCSSVSIYDPSSVLSFPLQLPIIPSSRTCHNFSNQMRFS